MTTTATLNPKYVNQPKPGGRLGSVKDEHGALWLVDPGLLPSFHPGQPIEVEWAPMKFSDGKESKKITGIVHGATSAPADGRGSTDKDRDIFVTGVVGRAMGSGKFAISDIPALAVAAMAAWQLVQTGGTATVHARGPETLDDNVPF